MSHPLANLWAKAKLDDDSVPPFDEIAEWAAEQIELLQRQLALAHEQLRNLSQPGDSEPHAKMWHREARRLAEKYNEDTFYHSAKKCRNK